MRANRIRSKEQEDDRERRRTEREIHNNQGQSEDEDGKGKAGAHTRLNEEDKVNQMMKTVKEDQLGEYLYRLLRKWENV